MQHFFHYFVLFGYLLRYNLSYEIVTRENVVLVSADINCYACIFNILEIKYSGHITLRKCGISDSYFPSSEKRLFSSDSIPKFGQRWRPLLFEYLCQYNAPTQKKIE